MHRRLCQKFKFDNLTKYGNIIVTYKFVFFGHNYNIPIHFDQLFLQCHMLHVQKHHLSSQKPLINVCRVFKWL